MTRAAMVVSGVVSGGTVPAGPRVARYWGALMPPVLRPPAKPWSTPVRSLQTPLKAGSQAT
jgi:hypothetical protein